MIAVLRILAPALAQRNANGGPLAPWAQRVDACLCPDLHARYRDSKVRGFLSGISTFAEASVEVFVPEPELTAQ